MESNIKGEYVGFLWENKQSVRRKSILDVTQENVVMRCEIIVLKLTWQLIFTPEKKLMKFLILIISSVISDTRIIR